LADKESHKKVNLLRRQTLLLCVKRRPWRGSHVYLAMLIRLPSGGPPRGGRRRYYLLLPLLLLLLSGMAIFNTRSGTQGRHSPNI
jgi:hypothetical protein